MKVAILGAGGLLGRHLTEELAGHGLTLLDRAACDIGDGDAVMKLTRGADVIANCGAFTNVDGAEKEEDAAYRANALGAENAARAAEAHGAKLVHVSTDFVFDGKQGEPYDELAAPAPQSVYARSKWAGEILAQQACRKLFLVRVQGLYGRGGKNFSSKLRELITAGKPLKLDAERRVQPTWARAAARQIVKLIGTDRYGTYHVSCKGAGTWADFARVVADKLGVKPAWQEVSTAQLAAPAARPPNCLFHHRMLALRGLDIMPDWRAALDDYLEEEAKR
jgi:dTDP-4-dehydrorhamnose reductase